MLGDYGLCIDYLLANIIFQVLRKSFPNDAEGLALVMANEVLDVFQYEGLWTMTVNQFCEPKEKVSLLLIIEPMFHPKAQFFGNARNAERLAGESSAEDVVGRNSVVRNGVNVAVGAFPKIRLVSFLSRLIPIRRKYALTPGAFKCDSKPTDATKEVNERKPAAFAAPVCICAVGLFAQCKGFARPVLLQASTPLHNSAVERPSALAILATFLMPGLRIPRSMPLMYVASRPARSASFSCVSLAVSRAFRTFSPRWERIPFRFDMTHSPSETRAEVYGL